MESALEAQALMTDEEDDLHVKTDDSSFIENEMDSTLKHTDDDDDDDDIAMTEEEEDDEDDASKATDKSPSKAKKKAVRLGTDDEGDEDDEDDDEMKDDTADEDDDDEDDDVLDEEDEEDDDKQEGNGENAAELAKIDVSDPKSMLRMLRGLPDEEARRHEHFRRSHFERGVIKRLIAKAIQDCSPADKKAPTVTQVMTIVMAGMAKGFVGELTAEARRIMEKNGEDGPIEPRHLREAQRQYYKRRPLARGRNLKRLLR